MGLRIEKREIIDKIRASLAREIAVLVQSAKSAREGATHEQSRPENDKDTRGLEAAYLAGAQAERARDLEKAAARLEHMELRAFRAGDGIALAALVEVELDGARHLYFLASAAGGTKVDIGGQEVQVVTPEAPLGQAMLGKTAGDVFEMRVRRDLREYEIVQVL